MNVVSENETKWTYFCLIIDPAQVKRSGVQGEHVCKLKTCWPTIVN